jgi:hypothetical protein
MHVLRRWLRVDKIDRVAVNPSVIVDLPLPLPESIALCAAGIEGALGGSLTPSDPTSGLVEGTFGLIQSERIACECVALDAGNTRVRIVSRTLLGPKPRARSDYVLRLADFLQRDR